MATVSRIEDSRDVATIRVLIVEDFVPFRQFIRSKLAKKSELEIIGEVSDGAEAVLKAEELQPELILLDVGLPTLDGIEAARRICQLCPNSQIVFVSQESSPDVVQEALRSGGCGYVLKSHAGIDLLHAIEAVRESRLFVSSGLLGHVDIQPRQTITPQ